MGSKKVWDAKIGLRRLGPQERALQVSDKHILNKDGAVKNLASHNARQSRWKLNREEKYAIHG
jgi:hypothetical protein